MCECDRNNACHYHRATARVQLAYAAATLAIMEANKR